MREFRTGYFAAPYDADRLRKPSYVQCRVNVTMPLCSARTGEAMLNPLSNFPAHVTGLRRVGRVNKHHGQPSRFGLVSAEVLKLSKRPSVQASSDALPGLDVEADVRQIFHADFTRTRTDGFCNDGLTGFVVDVLHMPSLSAGDSTELAFSSPATVGLETTAMGKVDVPVMPEFSAAPDLAGAGSCEIVFANVNPEDTTASNWRDIGKFEDEIEIPNALADDQFGFFGQATGKQVALMLATNERNLGASIEGKQRERVALDRVSALVEVDGRGLERNSWNRFVLGDTFVGLERLVSICDPVDSLTYHLTTKRRKLFAHRIIGQVVQGDAVPATMLDSEWRDGVAGLGVAIGKRRQCQRLFCRSKQLERYRAHYHIGENMRYLEESQPLGRCASALYLPGLKAEVSRSKI